MKDIVIPLNIQFLLFMLVFLISVFSVGYFVLGFCTKLKKVNRIIYGIIFIAGCVILQFLPEDAKSVSASIVFIGIPVLTASFIINFINARWHGGSRPQGLSVKAAVDELPAGICCYYPDGQIKLINKTMSRICSGFIGRGISNGETIEKFLEEKTEEVEESVHIAGLPDGHVYNFTEKEIQLEGTETEPSAYGTIKEIIATDVTEEYSLVCELVEKNKRLAEMNLKLKNLFEETKKTAIEKEVLNAKTKVHDDLGRISLMARRYLKAEKKDPEEFRKTVEEFKKQIYMFSHADPDEWRRDYEYVFTQARLLDMEIVINGELPKGGKRESLAVSAISCALLNSARHAGADKIYVDISTQMSTNEMQMFSGHTVERNGEIADEWAEQDEQGKVGVNENSTQMRNSTKENRICITIRDNGTAPAGNIEEKGGLKNLRCELESEGGELYVENVNGVVLKCVL